MCKCVYLCVKVCARRVVLNSNKSQKEKVMCSKETDRERERGYVCVGQKNGKMQKIPPGRLRSNVSVLSLLQKSVEQHLTL